MPCPYWLYRKGVLQYAPTQSHLLHQYHLLNFREAISFYTIEIYSAGNRIALIILSVPDHLVYSGFFYLVHQGRNPLAQEIVDLQNHMRPGRKGILDAGCRVERVRMVLG